MLLTLQAVPALTNSYVPGERFVKRVTVFLKRNVIIGGYDPERPKNTKKIRYHEL
jgi:hypothetical protein